MTAAAEGSEEPKPASANNRKAADRPMLFFLFLAYNKLNHEDVWDRFFARAKEGIDYKALVHCKDELACKQSIRSLQHFELIRSVPTTYCTDLVSGMNALLKAALAIKRPGVAPEELERDKFIFLSDSTVPVKPFKLVQERLTVEEGTASDFCIFPRNEWAEVTTVVPGEGVRQAQQLVQVAVKHHQWIILGRSHAKRAADHSNEHRDLMQQFQLNMFTHGNSWRNTGCLDEFWHFAVLFGSLSGQSSQSVYVQAFAGGPLATNNYEIQGECNTFVHWPPRASGSANNMTMLAQELSSDPGSDVLPPTNQRPAVIRRLSKTSLGALRKSWFLFARKVDNDAQFAGCGSLAEAFDGLVFADKPRAPEGHTATWVGQGKWLDNRQKSVSIDTNDGTLHLKGDGADMEAKGSYCKDDIWVHFTSGYTSRATLSSDRQQLTWSNGVTWVRARGGH